VQREEVRRVAAEALAALYRSRDARPTETLLGAGGAASDGDDALDARAIAARLARPSGSALPCPPPASDGAASFVAHAAPALDEALSRHRDLALRALDDLSGNGAPTPAGAGLAPLDRGPGAPALGPLPTAPERLSPAERAAWGALAAQVVDRLAPRLALVARSSDAQLAARAVDLLGGSRAPEASQAVRGALDHAAEEVRLRAIAALARGPGGDADDPVGRAPTIAPRCAARGWRERAACADGLAALAARGGPSENAAALARIVPLAGDSNGFLRERAARALGLLGPTALAPLAARARDELPEVRRATAEALASCGAGARTPLAALQRDADPSVRQAAERSIARLPAP
jgi:HEAT repeat protein